MIGNSDYENVAPLDNPKNDAVAVSAKLKTLGFRVHTMLDGTLDQMKTGITHFKTALAFGGVGVFYYAGHAAYIKGRNLVLPVDAPAFQSPDDMVTFSLDVSEVREPITQFFSALETDTRFAGICLGTAGECASSTPSAPPKQERAVPPPRPTVTDAVPEPAPIVKPIIQSGAKSQNDNGVIMVYAADEGQVSYDGAGDHSPFTQAILDEIDSGDSDVIRMCKRVRKRVMDAVPQSPVLEDRSSVNFDFRRPDLDPPDGVLRIIFLDCCRDNPFALDETLFK